MDKKNWLKGLFVGIIILFALLTITFVLEVIAIALNNNKVPSHDISKVIVTIWFGIVFCLMPYGSVPLDMSQKEFFHHWILSVLPILSGLFFLQNGSSLWIFFLWIYVSSVCVGYNIVVAQEREKKWYDDIVVS